MKLLQLLKLSHAELIMRRKTITMSVLAASVPLVIILMVSLVWCGVGNICLSYSNRPTDGKVYLVLEAEKGVNMLKLIDTYHGEVIGKVTGEKLDQYESPVQMLATMAGLGAEKVALAPGETFLEGIEWYEITKVKPIDFVLSSVYGYRAPFRDRMGDLRAVLSTDQVALVKFESLEEAYQYRQALRDRNMHSGKYIDVTEAFTNALTIYETFKHGSNILLIIGLVISGIILIGTFVYLLDQELHSMVVYRAIGASVGDLLVISLGYLLEIGLIMAGFVIIASTLGVLIFSGMNASYFGGLLTEFYGVDSPKVLLLGWNWDVLWVVVTILIAAPMSLLLTLDQFSVKKLSQKLKQD